MLLLIRDIAIPAAVDHGGVTVVGSRHRPLGKLARPHNRISLQRSRQKSALNRQLFQSSSMIRLLFFAALMLLPACMPAQSPLPATIGRVALRAARSYPMDSAVHYGRDSIVLVFRDSSLTPERRDAGTWMFGPPATKAEADGCPPEKVLGRRIARAVWSAMGKPTQLQQVVVRIRGPRVGDAFDYTEIASDLYYPRMQLAGRWVGDSIGRTSPRREIK